MNKMFLGLENPDVLMTTTFLTARNSHIFSSSTSFGLMLVRSNSMLLCFGDGHHISVYLYVSWWSGWGESESSHHHFITSIPSVMEFSHYSTLFMASIIPSV